MRRIEMIIGLILTFVGGCGVMDELGNLQVSALVMAFVGGALLLHSSRETV